MWGLTLQIVENIDLMLKSSFNVTIQQLVKDHLNKNKFYRIQLRKNYDNV